MANADISLPEDTHRAVLMELICALPRSSDRSLGRSD